MDAIRQLLMGHFFQIALSIVDLRKKYYERDSRCSQSSLKNHRHFGSLYRECSLGNWFWSPYLYILTVTLAHQLAFERLKVLLPWILFISYETGYFSLVLL